MNNLIIGNIYTYWLLRILLVSVLTFCGWGIAQKDKTGKDFWKWATPALILYSLIQGLRYMRGQDYYHYKQDLEGNLFTDYQDQIYLLWLDLFHSTGLHYAVGFVFYSFILFLSFLLVVKRFPKTAMWALPLFLLMLPETENLIRQYFATSFFLLALYSLYNNKRKKVIIFLLICLGIHFSSFIPMLLLLFILTVKIENKINRPWLLVAIYIFVYYFWEPSWFSFITDSLKMKNLNDDSISAHYIGNADRWFSEEGSISLVLGTKKATASIISKSVNFLSNASMIWYGYIAMKNNKKINIIYWFSYFALIIKTLGGDIEMYSRISQWFIYLTPILYGAIFAYTPLKHFEKLALIILFLITWGFYGFIRNFGDIGYAGCAFIWDI